MRLETLKEKRIAILKKYSLDPQEEDLHQAMQEYTQACLTIPLSQFLDEPKMISVVDVMEWIDKHSLSKLNATQHPTITDTEIERMAIGKYGNKAFSFAQQRDGFREGAKAVLSMMPQSEGGGG
jgi:hypothetical protein